MLFPSAFKCYNTFTIASGMKNGPAQADCWAEIFTNSKGRKAYENTKAQK